MKFPIIILEGCDCSGKTTLANAIMTAYPNHVYIHNAVADDIGALHRNALYNAIELSNTHCVIIDRLYLSEYVYGNIFRNDPSYCIDDMVDIIKNCDNIKHILCHIDKDSVIEMHRKRKNIEMFDDVSQVWEMYNTLINRTDLMVYNWKTDLLDLTNFTIRKY